MADRGTSLMRCLACFPFKKNPMIAVTWVCHLFEIINLLELFIIKISPQKFPDRFEVWVYLLSLRRKNTLMVIK